MNKATKARKYQSSKLQILMDEITPLELEQTRNKMQIAVHIADLMAAKGWSKSQFAEKLDKNPSEITKWLSGTQNFTVDVLTEIAFALNTDLTVLLRKQQVQTIYKTKYEVKIVAAEPPNKYLTPNKQSRSVITSHFAAIATNQSSFTPSHYN